ncbi:MAG: hypothetical protein BWY27_01046 [Bacteroidetes bacterium ADurb.Bin234]|jgi:hypothetical protein|nr:MAG: hypothetical protein BWY27_01046 [Bacteroidetes bacterium ADurb.Bin234]
MRLIGGLKRKLPRNLILTILLTVTTFNIVIKKYETPSHKSKKRLIN